MKKLLILCVVLIQTSILIAQWGGGEKYHDLKPNKESMEKFEKMRFGIFMHWGPSIMRGTSSWGRGNHPYDFAPKVPINEFDSLYLQFNPVLFDANDWISTVKKSGAKYYVITTKHHDGFCIWDSEYTDYDIMSTPYKRDVLMELSEECYKQGILFGTYYSICDWHHPEYPGRYGGDPRPRESSDMNKYKEYLYHQMDELVDKYKTNILWFDGSWESDWTHEDGMDLYKYLKDKNDKMIINNRVDKKQNLLQRTQDAEKYAGDYKTPEQEIGEYENQLPWESCITITEGAWHYKPQARIKTVKELINTLVQTVGSGGNLLLNIGPMPDGRLEMFQKKRLLSLGKWLENNGESIYETDGGPFKPNEYIVSTRKGNKIFIHILDWPENEILIPQIDKEIIKSYVLNGNEFEISYKDKMMEVSIPIEQRKSFNTILVFEIEGNPLEIDDEEPIQFKDLKSVVINKEPTQKYRGSGAKSLIDKKTGIAHNLFEHWIGYEEESFETVIDLSRVKIINKVKVGCLQNQDKWIFLPQKIEVSVSEDNINFNVVGQKEIELIQSNNASREEVGISLNNVEARYIKINIQNRGVCPEWHKGAGGKAWLFVDEILVE